MDKAQRLDFISGLLKLTLTDDWQSYFLPFLEELKTADLAKLMEIDDNKSRGRLQLADDLQHLETYLRKEKERLNTNA